MLVSLDSLLGPLSLLGSVDFLGFLLCSVAISQDFGVSVELLGF